MNSILAEVTNAAVESASAKSEEKPATETDAVELFQAKEVASADEADLNKDAGQETDSVLKGLIDDATAIDPLEAQHSTGMTAARCSFMH